MRVISVLLVCAISGAATGCALKKKQPDASRVDAPVEVPTEVSLQADRSALAELRKDVPEEVRRENDELAGILEMMAKGDEEPSKVRNRFSKAMRDSRQKHETALRDRRETQTRAERKAREEFLAKLQKDRASFMRKRRTTLQQRNDFFGSQDKLRRDYFAKESEKRRENESVMLEERKTYEDYARAKQSQFAEELKDYTARFYERQKAEALKKQAESKAKSLEKASRGSNRSGASHSGASPHPLIEEFKSIPKGPAIPLAPSEN